MCSICFACDATIREFNCARYHTSLVFSYISILLLTLSAADETGKMFRPTGCEKEASGLVLASASRWTIPLCCATHGGGL